MENKLKKLCFCDENIKYTIAKIINESEFPLNKQDLIMLIIMTIVSRENNILNNLDDAYLRIYCQNILNELIKSNFMYSICK